MLRLKTLPEPVKPWSYSITITLLIIEFSDGLSDWVDESRKAGVGGL